jgi:hypothetical protein
VNVTGYITIIISIANHMAPPSSNNTMMINLLLLLLLLPLLLLLIPPPPFSAGTFDAWGGSPTFLTGPSLLNETNQVQSC